MKHFFANTTRISLILLIFAPAMAPCHALINGAQMVELVDTRDLKSLDHCGRTGSSPVPGTVIDVHPMTYTDMSWDDFVQSLSYDQESMSEEAWSEYIEQLEWLHSHPLDINTASPQEMGLLPFLTPAQIEAIQAYVHLDGPMKSLGELALIPELDNETRRVLPLFFHVKDPNAKRDIWDKKSRWFDNIKNSVDTRMDIPLYYRKGYLNGAYRGTPLYHRLRWAMESDHVLAGVHAKKDPGEQFYDSYGGYAMIRNRGILQSVIIGDYRVGWGEGLVMSRGTYTSKSNLMSGTSQGVRPMTGVAEGGFLRGVAITLATPAETKARRGFSLNGTLFASSRQIDATLNSHGQVQTILENGYHRTALEMSKKHNTNALLLGAHVQANIAHFQLGATGYWQHFNRSLNPGSELYRKWYPQGQNFGVFGVHGGYSYYKWTALGEIAYSTNHGGIAALGRVHWTMNRNLKLGLLGRYYSHRFYSFQAAAISENANTQNERGVMLRMEARPWDRVSIISYVDFFSDYWPRYGMTASSSGQEFMLEGKFQMPHAHLLSLRYQMKRKAANDAILPLHRIKAQWTYTGISNCKLQSTASIHLATSASPGFALSQLAQASMLHNRALRLSLMGAYFNAPDYPTRVYIYEPSLWNSSASYSYYGHGLRIATSLSYTLPNSHWTIEAKYSLTHMLDSQTISSSLQEILSPNKNDISIQVRMEY